ncbi:MAG: metal-dependent transcriptional regulator, partial [Ruminococcus sp.]|nr:metal-dependent transcriptional regulator [Ruminococcus sp.]
MQIQESGQMYLETILVLSKKITYVRAIDVGEHMGYSKPSVSRAIGLLKKGGYVTSDKDGYLYLTKAGLELAEKIYSRHTLLTNFLI